MKTRKQLLLSVSLLSCCAVTGPAMAQQASGYSQLEEVVVTAERRQSTEQRTPAAVTVKTGDDMLTQGKYTLRNIIQDVPGVTGGEASNSGTSGGSGTDNPASGLTFRGVPSNLGVGGSITSTASAAAIYVDDVYSGVGGGYDIDRVEVLRGPQGTLYGRSATSGVVAIHTRDPQMNEFGGDIALETGSGSLKHGTGAVNLPIMTDKVAARVSANYYDRQGYRIHPGDDRTNEDLRAKLLIKPTDDVSLLLGYAQQRNKTQSGGGQFDQPTPDHYRFAPGVVGQGENNLHQLWAKLDWDLGPVVVTYIPAWRKFDQDASIILAGIFDAVQTIRTPESKFLTHELRFASDYESSLKWQAGVTTYDNELSDANELTANGAPPVGGLRFRIKTHKQTTAWGAFAEGTWAMRPDTRLTAGARFDHTEVQVEQDYTSILLITKSISGQAGFREFDNSTFKLRLEHDLTDANLIYASVATGFSPGDIALSTDANYVPEVVQLDAETLTAYEVGSKNRFFDNRLQLNGNIYYNDYSAFQLANVNFGTPQFPAFRTIAAPLKSIGAEVEMVARPWANGTVSANLSYTDSQLELSGLPASYQAQFYTDRVWSIPKLRGSVAYDHSLELSDSVGLMLHGDLVYSGEQDTARINVADAAAGHVPYLHQDAVTLLNLSGTVQFADGRYAVTGYVRNVLDETYKTGGLGPSAPTFIASGVLGDPRTWGLLVTAKF